MCNLGQFPCYM